MPPIDAGADVIGLAFYFLTTKFGAALPQLSFVDSPPIKPTPSWRCITIDGIPQDLPTTGPVGVSDKHFDRCKVRY